MLEPAPTKVAIIPFFDPDTTESGLIYIPEQAKERSDQGMVKYVGKDCKYLVPGDIVIFPGYSGKNLEVPDEGILIIIEEADVVAKMEGDTIEATEVPGLYFRGVDGTFFPANYEFAMAFIAEALDKAPWRKGMKSKEMMLRQHIANIQAREKR